MVVRGSQMLARALDDHTIAEAAFDHGWWRSGDLGHVERGFLYIESRVDVQSKSKGVTVVPESIEPVLENHPRSRTRRWSASRTKRTAKR